MKTVADMLDNEARRRNDTTMQRGEFPTERRITVKELDEMRTELHRCAIENKIARGEAAWI